MNKILNLKRGPLFFLLLAGPFFVPAIGFIAIKISGEMVLAVLLLTAFALLLSTVAFLVWFYETGITLSKYLPHRSTMRLTWFRILTSFAIIYILAFCTWVLAGGLALADSEDQAIGPPLAILVPLHLFAMFCMFYGLYFNAKVLKTVELKREVTFCDFSGEFFLFWFFPIGLWILQPRINNIVAQPPEDPYSNMDIFTQDMRH